MNETRNLIYNYFLAVGILWVPTSIAIIVFNWNFHEKEIVISLIIPLVFALGNYLKKDNKENNG